MNYRWLAVGGIAGTLFAALALVELAAPGSFRSLDSIGATAVAPLQTFAWISVFLAVTELGSTSGIILVALGSAYFLRKNAGLEARLAFILIGTTALANLAKLLVSRARPDALIWFDPLLTYSFPSGHATAIMALYGFLAVVSARLLHGFQKAVAVSACAIIILAVGLSRLVLNAHYLSDVAGGYLLGLALVALAFSVRAR